MPNEFMLYDEDGVHTYIRTELCKEDLIERIAEYKLNNLGDYTLDGFIFSLQERDIFCETFNESSAEKIYF